MSRLKYASEALGSHETNKVSILFRIADPPAIWLLTLAAAATFGILLAALTQRLTIRQTEALLESTDAT